MRRHPLPAVAGRGPGCGGRLALALCLACGCSAPAPSLAPAAPDAPAVDVTDAAMVPDAPPDAPPDRPEVADFPDHTRRRLDSVADFNALALAQNGFVSTKVVITAFDRPAERDVRFYDSHFFVLHDEWYWWRLLNGAAIPGDDGVAPTPGHSFETVGTVYEWAAAQATLPYDLGFYGDRLYSSRFYDVSLGPNRIRGLATLLHIEAQGARPEHWAFELEFSDDLDHDALVGFFEALTARVPPEIGRDLRFLVRSAEQESLAATMERQHLAYWDRILRYRDVVIPGARAVYSDGITAGTLRFIRAGERFDDTTSEDVLVFENTPDLLPQAAGLITAAPQTPLAHINLLARNRGIPNLHMAGVLDDPEIGQLARGWARVVLLSESPDRVVLASITNDQYARYRALLERHTPTLAPVSIVGMPYVLDLSAHPLADRVGLVPALGGKSSGMIALLADGVVEHPDRPLGITVRAYTEALAPLRPRIAAVLADPGFVADARVRAIALQGVDLWRARNPEIPDQNWASAWLTDHPAATALGDLARTGGLRGLIERTPIAPATLTAITDALRENFRALASTQGLRFRSSSNVEDVEGFNGAGLYESFTGFVDAASQPRASDRDKTVERAIQQVWGSFWSAEAFEERRAAGIDHLAAAMGVMVHPRFDDALERATGVCTFTLLPPSDPAEARLDVNVQAGTLSVANPDPTILPEVVRVTRLRGGGALRIERLARSTRSPDGDLLSDAQLGRLYDDAARVTRAWIDDENSRREAPRRARTATLDLEFHDMHPGWPAMRDGSVRPARLVIKQARTLEPGARIFLPEAATWPAPRDVLVRARRVVRDDCALAVSATVTLHARRLRVYTDASLPPDVGFSSLPLDVSLSLGVEGGALDALSWPAATVADADHTQLTATRDSGGTRYDARPGSPAARWYDRVTLTDAGELTVTHDGGRVTGAVRCASEVVYASPRDYLLSLLPR